MWFVSADARGEGTRDESLRVSAWEATNVLPSSWPEVLKYAFTVETETCK